MQFCHYRHGAHQPWVWWFEHLSNNNIMSDTQCSIKFRFEQALAENVTDIEKQDELAILSMSQKQAKIM